MENETLNEGGKTHRKLNRSCIEKVTFGVLIFVISIAPLPLGSNSTLFVAFLAIVTSVALVCWTISLGLGGANLHIETNTLKWPILIYFAVCSWVFIQWSSLTPPLFADPIWQSMSEVLNVPLQSHISVNPDATIAGLINLLVYGTVFWLTFQMTQTSERAWMLIRAIAYTGCAYATYGIIIYMMGNEWVVIYPKTDYLDSLTSTFVNRNSYATFSGLALLCAAALLLNHMKYYFALKHPFRAKLAIIIEELAAKSSLKTLAVLTIIISLLLSASRGGIFSSVIGLITLLLIYWGQQRSNVRHTIFAVTTLVVLGSILVTISGNYFSKRMESSDINASVVFRNYMYALTWEAIKSSPFTGTGLGTYADVIPAYKEDRIGAPLQRWDKAHNTYLENALELGLPAAAMLNLSIALVALTAAGGISRRRRDKLIPSLGVCATILVALHSLVDFSLQIPAVTLLYVSIMGVAASQSWSTTSSNSA